MGNVQQCFINKKKEGQIMVSTLEHFNYFSYFDFSLRIKSYTIGWNFLNNFIEKIDLVAMIKTKDLLK